MNFILLVFYVFGSSLTDSPYFYDKHLDEICLRKITNNIIDHCNPSNCIAIDKLLKEGKNQAVFVNFIENNCKDYYFIKIGERTGISFKYIKELNVKNCKEIINEMVKEIKTRYNELKNFDVYFTIDLEGNKNAFFKEEILKNSIRQIKKCFKKKLGKNSVVKYISCENLEDADNLIDHFSETKMLKLVDCETMNLVFFHETYLDHFYRQLEAFILQYEQSSMDETIYQYHLENHDINDLFILYVLKKMKKSLNDNISISQTGILLKIWEFLKNKKEFYSVFCNIFSEKEQEKIDVHNIDTLLNLSIEENINLLTREGFIDVIRRNESGSKATKIFLLVNNINEKELKEITRIFISRLFSVLLENFESLVKVIVSKNLIQTLEYRSLSKDFFLLYKKYIENLLFNRSKGSEKKNLYDKEKEFIQNLKTKCLNRILKKNKNEITILNVHDDEKLEDCVRMIHKMPVEEKY